jgi:hypothetical protein
MSAGACTVKSAASEWTDIAVEVLKVVGQRAEEPEGPDPRGASTDFRRRIPHFLACTVCGSAYIQKRRFGLGSET